MLTTPRLERPRTMEDLLSPALCTSLDRLDLRSRRMFPGKLQGERRSKRRGRSVEFEDFRPYAHGDDLRFVDWNVFARLDRLFIKIFLEEEDLSLHIALDASASMATGDPSKLLSASRLAMALGYVGLVRHNRVGMTLFGAPWQRAPVSLPEMRGRHNVSRMSSFVVDEIWDARRAPDNPRGASGPEAMFGAALKRIATTRTGTGVMVVISDYLVPDGYEAGLRSLAGAGGYDTFCVQMLSPQEIEPEKALERGLAGDLRLSDIETGRACEVSVNAELVRAYRSRLETFCAALKSYATARGMTHLLVRSDTPVDDLVLRTLRGAGLVG